MRTLSAAVLVLLCTPALAGTSAGYGMGGRFNRFDPVVSQHNQSGELFRIEGHCQSACTLFLGIRNVCIDRNATLLFHAGHDLNKNIADGPTAHMLNAYNSSLRNYVTSNRYVDTLEFHTISGRDMIQKFGYRECPKKYTPRRPEVSAPSARLTMPLPSSRPAAHKPAAPAKIRRSEIRRDPPSFQQHTYQQSLPTPRLYDAGCRQFFPCGRRG